MNAHSANSQIKKSLQYLRMFDIYPLLRPLLFTIDPETAHDLAIWALQKGLGPCFRDEDDLILSTKVCGLRFSNPIGLAAGFDRHAKAIGEFFDFGFGSVEVGGITPLPQPGNPKTRLFRISQANGIINRMGFPGEGMAVCARRIAAWRDSMQGHRCGVFGIQIVKNKDTVDAVSDYIACLETFASLADYVTVNVSSPNTPGLRDLQEKNVLTNLLQQVIITRNKQEKKPPIFVKIAPDQTEQQVEDIAAAVMESGVDAMIIGNTSLTRPSIIPADIAKEAGGFSGPAMFAPTTQLLSNMYKLTQGKIPLIGNCGIFSGEDAYAKIRAGASLVQLYTALVYKGPALIPRIKRDLAALLRRDGFTSVAQAVGADHR